MTGELSIGGVYIHPLLIAALCAFLMARLVEELMARARLYRFVWHRGLFDTALTIVLWGGFSVLLTTRGGAAALLP